VKLEQGEFELRLRPSDPAPAFVARRSGDRLPRPRDDPELERGLAETSSASCNRPDAMPASNSPTGSGCGSGPGPCVMIVEAVAGSHRDTGARDRDRDRDIGRERTTRQWVRRRLYSEGELSDGTSWSPVSRVSAERSHCAPPARRAGKSASVQAIQSDPVEPTSAGPSRPLTARLAGARAEEVRGPGLPRLGRRP